MIRSIFISLSLICLSASIAGAQIPRVQTGGASDRVETADGLSAEIYARRLGEIADMVSADDGTIYLADRSGGRIMRVLDRDRNGQAELSQPLPHRFDGPGGLAIIGETLFVSDRGGVWRIDPDGGTPTLLAPFARAGATDDPAPLIVRPDGTIRLGLNRSDGTTSLIDVDPVTGRAKAIEQARGRILSFAKSARPDDGSPAPFWVVLQRDDTILAGSSLSAARIMQDAPSHLWLDPATGQALMAIDGGVRQARASFGGLSASGDYVLSGLSGSVGPLLADERGLFVADPEQGRMWRIHAAPRPQAIPSDDIAPAQPEGVPEPDQETPSSQPELLRGSGIGRASRMGPASTMDPASTLPPAQSPTSPSEDPSDER